MPLGDNPFAFPRVSLRFCNAEPRICAHIVFKDALALIVHHTKIELRSRFPPFSKRLPQSESFLMVTRSIRRHPILEIPRRHRRRGEQHEGGQGGDQGVRIREV